MIVRHLKSVALMALVAQVAPTALVALVTLIGSPGGPGCPGGTCVHGVTCCTCGPCCCFFFLQHIFTVIKTSGGACYKLKLTNIFWVQKFST